MSGDETFDPTGLSALVLDRNHYERGISLDLLRSMGFRRVVGAADVDEGWDALRKVNPSIVFLDWFDGQDDPIGFVRRVRWSEDAASRAVPMFMLTSRGQLADVETARMAGVDGYLRKPISALAMQRHVRAVMLSPQPFVVGEAYIGPCRRRRDNPGFAGPWRRGVDESAASGAANDD